MCPLFMALFIYQAVGVVFQCYSVSLIYGLPDNCVNMQQFVIVGERERTR